MPRLAEGNTSRPATQHGRPSASSTRCASSSAISSPSMPSMRMANSSPPRRATVSPSRMAPTMRRPASTSSSSPAEWPTLSFTSLKRSRSRNSTAKPRAGLPPAAMRPLRATVIASVRRSSNCWRLGSPVSASWRAWWVRRCSARRRSPICSSSSAFARASSPVRSSTRCSSLACAATRRSWDCLRINPMPMWWATKVSSSWSRRLKLIAGE